jgi:4-amino-4-deoxy-L-arabinose transferase-like glycosyltransferase
MPFADLERTDFLWAAATGLASALVFAMVVSSHPGLSDASEAVAGVSSLGILHAPGYPAYVLVAKAFTLLVPFGDEAFRVSLFSLVCASLSVAGVWLLARRSGAARWAATLGALCLATSAGFWFYSGFAKHDMFSGLAFLIALSMLLAWDARPSTGRLVGTAAALAIGFGSSWPLMIMLGPCCGFVLIRGRRKLSLRSVTLAVATGAVLLVGIYGFVMVRAAENPPLNWGSATTPSALLALVGRSDFSTATDSTSNTSPQVSTGSGSSSSATSDTHARPNDLKRTFVYVEMFSQELGIAGVLLAFWGLLASLWRQRSAATIPLLLLFGTNLVGAVVTVGASRLTGFDTGLIEEGFLLGCYFALAAWVALGASDLVALGRSLAPVRRLRESGRVRLLAPGVVTLMAAAILTFAVTGNWSVAHRSDNAFADDYAKTVFAELPPRAAVFVWGPDLSLPLTYRQVVDKERPSDVIIAVGGLAFGWYRRQISRELGTPLPSMGAQTLQSIASVVRSVAAHRPTYIDVQATEFLRGIVGYRTDGLVAQVVPGRQPASAGSAAALQATVRALENQADITNPAWRGWPNAYLFQDDYVTLQLGVARAYYDQRDLGGMRRALQGVLRISPGNRTARSDLALLASQGGG